MAVDFHSHILPRIDDGSRSVEESIAMLRMSAQQGVREVILTPHFYPQRSTPERFLDKRDHSMALLWEHMNGMAGLPAVRCGAEVYYYPQMSHSDSLRELAIEGTEYILVEMPMGTWTDSMYRELEAISYRQGLTPIIAHVDRYLGRFWDHGIPGRLTQLPVLVQANASFFLKGTKGMAMLRKRQIHLLGSDCHNLTDRAPNLAPAVNSIRSSLGTDALKWIRRNERAVLG